MIGFWGRVSAAFQCFVSIVSDGQIPAEVTEKLATEPSTEDNSAAVPKFAAEPQPAPSDTPDRATQVLGLLQRDGRLIDFLAEDISPYPDAQLGAAVRSIHRSCRGVLDQYVKLEPVLNAEENQPVTVPAGFDASTIKLVGNVSGQPPLRGILRHKGWRVSKIDLPPLPPQTTARSVIAPAEVELP